MDFLDIATITGYAWDCPYPYSSGIWKSSLSGFISEKDTKPLICCLAHFSLWRLCSRVNETPLNGRLEPRFTSLQCRLMVSIETWIPSAFWRVFHSILHVDVGFLLAETVMNRSWIGVVFRRPPSLDLSNMEPVSLNLFQSRDITLWLTWSLSATTTSVSPVRAFR